MDLKFKDNSKLKLAPFTQLEYIESTGTQYIDTGIKPDNNNQTFKIGVSFLSNVQYIGSGETNKAEATANIFRNNNNALAINWGTWSSNGSVLQANYPLETLAEIEIKAGNSVKLNGNNTAVTAQNVSFNSGRTANFILNGRSDALNNTIAGSIARTYYFIVENAGVEILHLIPAKDNVGVVCMYDTVSKTFFYNQGTGDFVAGPEGHSGIVTLPNDILLKTTTVYHKNTPNVNGLQLLNGILSAQEAAEDVVLNRIRVDIGNVSGTLTELLQYAGMAGFNDNYEPQAKPRLVGTWTINDWYATAQFAQAQAAFDGLTIVGNLNYLLDFSQMAVQVLDPNEDNYNPAVAIILQGQNLGTTMTDAPLGNGRWFMSKSQAAAVTNVSNWFSGKTTITDTNGIISDITTQTYDFESFDEFKYFTGFNVIGAAFFNCTKLKTIYLPDNIIELRGGNLGNGTMACCTSLIHIHIPYNLQIVGNFALRFLDSLEEAIEFPASVTKFQYECMIRDTKIPYIHINSTTRPILESTNAFANATFKIYVGDGSSASNDNAILADYLADTNWATYSSRLDTWYNYLHPTT